MDKKLCVIIATLWFDGCNTYFTGRIYIDSEVITIPFEYGYGNHFEFVAKEILKNKGFDLNNYLFRCQPIDVKNKKDMIK